MPEIAIDENLKRHFHLFWDNFPAPVLLLHKDRTILARNQAAEAAGMVPGTRCSDRGGAEVHRGCLAVQALREQSAKRSVEYIEQLGVVMDSYWIPLPGHPDLYVHFGIDITAFAAERLFPSACRGGAACTSCSGA
ncbi:hypothetical protein DESUT3_35430 [Desulfuromonas versatilis]|uniref:PAS domain-containing protein n=1 Tax=Desulfuromonas versatilis TaxID=2802975 RepID=A0ABN6E3U6_9BACT|nr:hypothetical protein [Desulfuromonas versatilis]BCR06474.1 hypothetical protein DESUT3_35430 [Desulfuromonas versatilis]